MFSSFHRKLLVTAVLVLVAGVGAITAATVEASHSWGTYHWARTANPFTLKLSDSVTSQWDAYLAQTSADWSVSTILDTTVVPGYANPKNCRATAGQVEVCNSRYGGTGWLGIASIWASGNHITQATVKLNDTYFNTTKYNTPEWRAFVMCQEVGHVFGLDHQDENFTNANLDTCMDYTNLPASNQHPNQHDYDMLDTIYAHLDSSTSISQTTASQSPATNNEQVPVDSNNPHEWGRAIRTSSNGHHSLYVRDLGNDNKIFTFVVWAE